MGNVPWLSISSYLHDLLRLAECGVTRPAQLSWSRRGRCSSTYVLYSNYTFIFSNTLPIQGSYIFRHRARHHQGYLTPDGAPPQYQAYGATSRGILEQEVEEEEGLGLFWLTLRCGCVFAALFVLFKLNFYKWDIPWLYYWHSLCMQIWNRLIISCRLWSHAPASLDLGHSNWVTVHLVPEYLRRLYICRFCTRSCWYMRSFRMNSGSRTAEFPLFIATT